MGNVVPIGKDLATGASRPLLAADILTDDEGAEVKKGAPRVLSAQSGTGVSLGFTVPGGTLTANGHSIRVDAMIYTGGGTNLTWSYGGTTVAAVTGLDAGEYSYVSLLITYSGANAQQCVAIVPVSGGAALSSLQSTGLALAKANGSDQEILLLTSGEVRFLVVTLLIP